MQIEGEDTQKPVEQMSSHEIWQVARAMVHSLLTSEDIICYEDYDTIWQCSLCSAHIPAIYSPPGHLQSCDEQNFPHKPECLILKARLIEQWCATRRPAIIDKDEIIQNLRNEWGSLHTSWRKHYRENSYLFDTALLYGTVLEPEFRASVDEDTQKNLPDLWKEIVEMRSWEQKMVESKEV